MMNKSVSSPSRKAKRPMTVAEDTAATLKEKREKAQKVHTPFHLMDHKPEVDVKPLECLLCKEPMRKIDAKILPNCGHAFHFDCIDPVFRRELRRNTSERITLRCPYCLASAELTTQDIMSQRKVKLYSDGTCDHSSPRGNKMLSSPRRRLEHNLSKYDGADYYQEVGEYLLRDTEKTNVFNNKLLDSHGKRPTSPDKLTLQGMKTSEARKKTMSKFGQIVRNESRLVIETREAARAKKLAEEQRRRREEEEAARKKLEEELAAQEALNEKEEEIEITPFGQARD